MDVVARQDESEYEQYDDEGEVEVRKGDVKSEVLVSRGALYTFMGVTHVSVKGLGQCQSLAVRKVINFNYDAEVDVEANGYLMYACYLYRQEDMNILTLSRTLLSESTIVS